MLAELSTRDISAAMDPETLNEHAEVERQGGEIARNARIELEQKTGQKVVTTLNAKTIRALKKEDDE